MAGFAAGTLALPPTLASPRAVYAREDDRSGPAGLYSGLEESEAVAPPDYEPWWVRVFLATRLWPTQHELDNPVGRAEQGQYFRVEVPQNGPRLRVFDPRSSELVYIGAEAVGPVDPPVWADYLNGQDGRWIDVTLTVPQHALAMQGDVLMYRALVTAGLQGTTRPGHYSILRRVYNETMDSRTVPGLRDTYLLKNVLFTQYFTGDGAAIHYNWWGPPYGFGRPGSHGCLGMMYNDSKYFWDWADIGVPVIIHN
jgi:hypothetical protein